MGQALRTCAIAVALARALGCDDDEVRAVHQVALLRFLGCTSDAPQTAVLAGGDERAFLAAMAPAVMGSGREMMGRLLRTIGAGQPTARRIRLVARALSDPKGGDRSMSTHCEVGAMLARRMGLQQAVVDALAHAYERWDGKGAPDGLRGDAIPLAVRMVVVARDVDLATLLEDDALVWLQKRKGRAYDPAVVEAFEQVGPQLLAALEDTDEWDACLSAEPEPLATVGPDELDDVLLAFADFADLKSPWIRGHSREVAALAERAARHARMSDSECELLRRAALVHDLGRVAIENGIWDKPSSLTRAEQERVRLHAHYSERILPSNPKVTSAPPSSRHASATRGSTSTRLAAAQTVSGCGALSSHDARGSSVATLM